MSKKKFHFKEETSIERALSLDPRVGETFERLGLRCVNCVAQSVETLRHAALYHGRPIGEILRELNRLNIRAPD